MNYITNGLIIFGVGLGVSLWAVFTTYSDSYLLFAGTIGSLVLWAIPSGLYIGISYLNSKRSNKKDEDFVFKEYDKLKKEGAI